MENVILAFVRISLNTLWPNWKLRKRFSLRNFGFAWFLTLADLLSKTEAVGWLFPNKSNQALWLGFCLNNTEHFCHNSLISFYLNNKVNWILQCFKKSCASILQSLGTFWVTTLMYRIPRLYIIVYSNNEVLFNVLSTHLDLQRWLQHFCLLIYWSCQEVGQ